jgi:hypothetical protein
MRIFKEMRWNASTARCTREAKIIIDIVDQMLVTKIRLLLIWEHAWLVRESQCLTKLKWNVLYLITNPLVLSRICQLFQLKVKINNNKVYVKVEKLNRLASALPVQITQELKIQDQPVDQTLVQVVK